MTVREALLEANTSIEQPDAELLLGHVLGQERAWLLAHPEAGVDAEHHDRFVKMVKRRAGHEPLQYIVGAQEFFGLQMHVSPAVLIPRPETELLVEAVIDWAKQRHGVLRIVDVGTGSGAIALALAANLPEAEIVTVDVSVDALAVARGNAARLGLARHVTFLQGNLLTTVEALKPFDVVVSNPPYVPARDAATIQRDVVEHEPHLALFAGDDGLDIYRRLVPQAENSLREGGLLAMEFGYGQVEALSELMKNWQDVQFINDYAGIPRIVLATRREMRVSETITLR